MAIPSQDFANKDNAISTRCRLVRDAIAADADPVNEQSVQVLKELVTIAAVTMDEDLSVDTRSQMNAMLLEAIDVPGFKQRVLHLFMHFPGTGVEAYEKSAQRMVTLAAEEPEHRQTAISLLDWWSRHIHYPELSKIAGAAKAEVQNTPQVSEIGL